MLDREFNRHPTRGGTDPLLATRGRKAVFTIGQPVIVSGRCGDWGEGNRGRVVAIAETLDPKGRHFIGVKMDGMPDHVGKPECAQLDYPEAKRERPVKVNDQLLMVPYPPLPHFEAGLVAPVKA